MISIFDIYKIGVGPSSSHTVGPMKAGYEFVEELKHMATLQSVTKVTVDVYGSLSLTGKGHHTDIAIIMGLAGNLPQTVDIDSIDGFIKNVEQTGKLALDTGSHIVDFPTSGGMSFHSENLALHENGMQIHAWADNELVHSKTYYSIGGGFIVDEASFGQSEALTVEVPYAFDSATSLVEQAVESGLSISTLVLKNEKALHSDEAISNYLAAIWQTMSDGIERGMNTEGVLPGPLRVHRRAPCLYKKLSTSAGTNADPMAVVDWINLFAFAVNEENAAGGRVVTAPTNGACGIVPAVLAYYDKFIQPVTAKEYTRYFAASGAIGSLYKRNASISGAEVGCQGEVGVACSMAAAGLAELMGGSPEQVCMAAEIGMEHNLGLTCDPVAGQVQVPCIERNGIAAVKAVNSARMALGRTSAARVSLDKVIETMLETGKDMNAKYRETSQGGLAIKVLC
ncbi:L-serine ammonia-lyase [Vibrio breoganii]|uniref:L-serine ammonia-lyase n=1 Tax=Vibrio breoganii TaxID=553239 RepID=UPI000C81FE12|nr:L-serine ammonia-lyase [Vibrio breoganii]PMM47969.1 L-serine ammonia-lyase [Vibrio breoganii]PMO88735.1 L-serine ammonia-lyase [Vibrio breoganii]